MDACPKCGRATEPTARACPACGVILAKARPRTEAPRPSPAVVHPPAPEGDDEPSGGQAVLKVGLATALALGAFMVLRQFSPPPPASAPAATQVTRAVPALPAPELTGQDVSSLSNEDVSFLNALSARLQKSPEATATEAEIERVEKILTANRESAPLRNLMMVIYMRRADHDLRLGSFVLVDEALVRMKILNEAEPEVYAFETVARAQRSDWEGAVSAARKYESLSGDATLNMSYTLAVALERLNRRPDAVAVLDRPVFQRCPSVTSPADRSVCLAVQELRAALAQSGASAAPPEPAAAERRRAVLNIDDSKEQLQSDKFDVRFDGENQTGVARDVLFVLDRAYTRLTDVYYDRPLRKIPVVLHSSQDYFTKTGAPWWSGGVYSSHNGAIQIPIRGLPSTLPPEMEDVLVHELSHAFVDEMSGGFAGRDLQEGLAQYMEGKRIEQLLSAAELKSLANSSGPAVGSFYMLSLAVSEQLVQSRGQSMVNRLLKAMKDTGSEDGGFQRVFGQPGASMKKEILETFWRRYS